jgi:O-antigen chain-terminating methyltransferase
MKRTIEKLSHQRKKEEETLGEELRGIHEAAAELLDTDTSREILDAVARLEQRIQAAGPPEKRRPGRRWFGGSKTNAAEEKSSEGIERDLLALLKNLAALSLERQERSLRLISSLAGLFEQQARLGDLRDREWDALGNNHVGMIFKSLERRVDKLAAGNQDASLLIKTHQRLRGELGTLLKALERRESPTREAVEALARPMDDTVYAGFENRHRGSGEQVVRQQQVYLEYFKPGRKVLDLGCGRGEFIELLKSSGIEAEGIDLNHQMIALCRERGLPCRRADLLDALSEQEDGSLGGIFSSQVIEHLSPPDIKRLVELSWIKLAPGAPIILETINPVSVFALVQTYFLDLTHRQPVPPGALEFLLESSGYQNIEIQYSAPLKEERLRELPTTDESTRIFNENIDKLNQLLYAPANYAAIGRKA